MSEYDVNMPAWIYLNLQLNLQCSEYDSYNT